MCVTSIYSTVSYEYPDQRVRYIGYIEMCLGLGMFLGPFISGFMYSYLEYLGTFIFFGLLLVIGFIISVAMIPSRINFSNLQQNEEMPRDIEQHEGYDEYYRENTYFFFLEHADIIMMLILLTVINITIF